jgi:hypothetical protein
VKINSRRRTLHLQLERCAGVVGLLPNQIGAGVAVTEQQREDAGVLLLRVSVFDIAFAAESNLSAIASLAARPAG